jgi:hypothetical protein
MASSPRLRRLPEAGGSRRLQRQVGGLGLGYTLRAALDSVLKTARVHVAELNAAVKRWCEGPLLDLAGKVVLDQRVTVVVEDVTPACAAPRAPAPSASTPSSWTSTKARVT